MPVPNLIHALKVTVEPLDLASTRYDRDAREPIQVAARSTPVTLDGQLSSSLRKGAFTPSRTGPVDEEDGYILFRAVDLKSKGLTADDKPLGFRQGDRVTKVDVIPVKLYVIRVEPLGTYAGLGFTLVKAYVSDRAPAKTV